MADLTATGGRCPPDSDMAWISGGTFKMGSDSHYPEEAPEHRVSVDGFWIDRRTVTNQQFAEFVADTRGVLPAHSRTKRTIRRCTSPGPT